ncbi:conserved phage C-terminal domain-containing protein [Clostridium perfringens]|nr:conserved phage C-terminal domain-containing protein [Clostridium perfringens]
MNRSYYAIIPANVRYDKDLTPNAKLLYGEITALCNEKGYCWANNGYFADLYSVSKVSISKWINQLIDKAYIRSEIIYKNGTKEIDKRCLYIGGIPIKEKFNTSITSVNEGTKEKFNTPIKEKFKDNNTVINNTFNNNIYSLVIDKLNTLANKSYKTSSKKTQQLIRARVNEGFTVEDFYKVIENKVCTWKDDPKMDQYLRPATLFGTKFESYLNEKATKPIKGENYGKYRDYEQQLDREDKEIISNEEAERTAASLGIEL